jgi:hypothetical protein
MLEAAEADLALEAGFVQCEGAPGIPENLAAKFVDARRKNLRTKTLDPETGSRAGRLGGGQCS